MPAGFGHTVFFLKKTISFIYLLASQLSNSFLATLTLYKKLIIIIY